MYAGFNLEYVYRGGGNYESLGETLTSRQSAAVKKKLDSFLDANGILDGSKMRANWFPAIDAQVFISHSHKDKRAAVELAGWLNQEFGLSSFIDSCVWGCADDLLRLIDDKYCLNPSGDYYNYSKRNRSTSHVHMMLTTALSKMIDQSECLMFLNTPSSITPASVINESEKTDSPWIYSEIAMTRLIRRKTPQQHRSIIRADSVQKTVMAMDESFKVNYDVQLDHLTDLSFTQLKVWARNCRARNLTGPNSLDELYTLTNAR